jgi:redox-sensing transcriptional repressor
MQKEKVCSKKKCFSPEVIKRLSLYLRDLRRMQNEGVDIISSDEITKILDVSSAQFRKDLSYFGEFGKRGVGYKVNTLVKELEQILGIDRWWPIALAGVGRLGSALLGFSGFGRFKLKIAAAFDNDKRKIGKVISGVKITPIENMEESIKEHNIEIGMICVPPQFAQQIANRMISAGIKAILNFAPASIKLDRNDVYISNVDMACELETLVYFLSSRG